MKKILLGLAFTALATLGFAQSKFETAMQPKIAKIEQHLSLDDFQTLSNDFSRIGDAEKTQWLPYYYAAFSQIQKGRLLMQENKTSDLDAIAAEAQKYLDKSIALNPENAENYILQKMIHGMKMMVNPMERWQTEGTAAQKALSKAESLDADNPRVSVLKAEDLYFTPPQFGGSKEKGLEMFQNALKQFETYQSKSNLDPNWGKAEANYFLTNKP